MNQNYKSRMGKWLIRSHIAAFLIALLIMPQNTVVAGQQKTLVRTDDPVVMTGSDLPSLQGIAPSTIVAFRHINNAWQQVPVQVDERAVVNLAVAMNRDFDSTVSYLDYTDANTFTGADPDSSFDTNDELVFMSKDTGDKPAVFSEPANVQLNSGVEVTVNDPLNVNEVGFIYLFIQDGSLNQSAGQQYVNYNFSLNSGSYLSTYNTSSGPNPENSIIETPYYKEHFSDRWVNDERVVKVGNSSKVDILDRNRSQFGPNECSRSEDTFSQGPGSFIVNKNGPVRAIRSYQGANSGDYTQRQNIFYERRQDITTNLRVHPIAASGSFMDYSPLASGMTYYNQYNQLGLLIDGNPEGSIVNDLPQPPVAGAASWEMVSGAQGTVSYHHSFESNISQLSSWTKQYYLDDTTPPYSQCTGDSASYGASGIWIDPRPNYIPCTDPRPGKCNSAPTVYTLALKNTVYYDAPGASVSSAVARNQQSTTPLAFSVAVWQQTVADTEAPVVSLTQPQASAVVQGMVTMAANATDNVGVVGVRFKVDGVVVGTEDTASPYAITWNSASVLNGNHSITAVARDAAGNSSESVPVVITVNNDVTAPTTAITSPANNAQVTKRTNVTITATASDAVGVTKVEFYVSGALRCTDTTAPYTCVWTVPNTRGVVYPLQSKAYDTAGNVGSSAIVHVTSK